MIRIIIFLVVSFFVTNAYSSPKFDKDLKKFSKDNGFIDSKGKIYSKNEIKDKKNSILIIYNHGSDNDQKSDKCAVPGNDVPKVIRDLHDKNIKNLIDNFENHIDPNDPTNNCLDVAIITAPEKRTKKTIDKLKTVAGRVLDK